MCGFVVIDCRYLAYLIEKARLHSVCLLRMRYEYLHTIVNFTIAVVDYLCHRMLKTALSTDRLY